MGGVSPIRGLSPRRIVLASASPRRRDLLEAAGFEVIIRPSEVSEIEGGLPPRELVAANAELKATAVDAEHHRGELILAADTIVVLEGRIFGKPRDLSEASEMLRQLGGRTHEVLTGVCMLRGGSPSRCSFVDSTKVAFKALNEESISSYLAEINPLDKAGAYAAQEDRGRLIERIEGSLENVIGLPVARVVAAIQQHFTVPSSG